MSLPRFIPMTGDERARVEAILTGEREPAPLRAAATVALVRDGDSGLEVYLMRRVRGMAFAAGVHVFPGGGVDEQDGAGTVAWRGPEPAWWAGRFGTEVTRMTALVRAAVRETFEETGVLLAGTPGGPVLTDVSGPEWEAEREAVDRRDRTLADVLSVRGLEVRTDLLAPLAHWITPVVQTRRYDTHFFLAVQPPGQESRAAGSEADARLWVRPAQALERGLGMLPPTRAVLAGLAAHPDTAAAMAAEWALAPVGLRSVLVPGGVELHLEGSAEEVVRRDG